MADMGVFRSFPVSTLALSLGCGGGTAAPNPPPPPPSVTLTVAVPPSVAVGGTISLSATTSPSTTVSWTTETPSVATVAAGKVTGVAPGTATLRASAGATNVSASILVYAPAFLDLAMGTYHACGRSSPTVLHCWGNNGAGQLGVVASSETGCPSVGAPGGTVQCSSTPVVSTPGLAFSQLAAGGNHACGLTSAGEVYCWGSNAGQVLLASTTETCNNNTPCRKAPLKVANAPALSSIAAGFDHFCGLAGDGRAHCWGQNGFGQIGGSSTATCDVTPCAREPIQVLGNRSFASLALGWYHSCGLTAAGEAYCWGWNFYGQLGTGVTGAFDAGEPNPVAVNTPLRFSLLRAGRDHTCGLTLAGAAHCWGLNTTGQLGDGSMSQSLVPRAVSGGHSFVTLAAGLEHTCGLTASGAAWCWGHNHREASTEFGGQLGDGTFETRLVPTVVATSKVMVQLVAGRATTCGRIAAGAVYCWGSNENGIVGTGDRATKSFPLPTGVGGLP